MREEIEELLKEHLGWTPTCSNTESALTIFVSAIEDLYQQEKLAPLEVRRQAFIDSLRPHLDEYGSKMLNNFSKYWLTKGDRDRKFRFEKEKTFSLKARLVTWEKNSKKFSIVGMLKNRK